MRPSALYMKLAQTWHEAAGDAVNEELRACYATRAAKYLELAARAHPGKGAGRARGVKMAFQ